MEFLLLLTEPALHEVLIVVIETTNPKAVPVHRNALFYSQRHCSTTVISINFCVRSYLVPLPFFEVIRMKWDSKGAVSIIHVRRCLEWHNTVSKTIIECDAISVEVASLLVHLFKTRRRPPVTCLVVFTSLEIYNHALAFCSNAPHHQNHIPTFAASHEVDFCFGSLVTANFSIVNVEAKARHDSPSGEIWKEHSSANRNECNYHRCHYFCWGWS